MSKLSKRVLVIGYPQLKGINEQYNIARKIYDNHSVIDIYYQLHPSDCVKKAQLDSYGDYIQSAIEKYPINYGCADFSIEVDFLLAENVPEFVVTYNSSSVVWLRTVFNDRVSIILVDL